MVDNFQITYSEKLSIPLLIRPGLSDLRGRFDKLFDSSFCQAIDTTFEIKQVNRSITIRKGARRGLHFQLPPYGEAKVVSCVLGSVFDVVVDLRRGSSTFLQWESFELSEDIGSSIFIPEGFAHGFQALTDNDHLLYFHNQHYSPSYESGLNLDDPQLAIEWPITSKVISSRDSSFEFLLPNFEGYDFGM